MGQALAKPQNAPPFSLSGELVREQTGQQWPTWDELTGGVTDRLRRCAADRLGG